MAIRLIDVTPAALVEWPGFAESLDYLRRNEEHPLLRNGGDFDLDFYEKLYAAGVARFVLVHTTELKAWGVIMTTRIPRRQRPMVVMDVFWSNSAPAGVLLMLEARRHARRHDTPLLVTARIGGALHAGLLKHHQPSHATFALT